ncbi:preprotein translocase subunit YajC [Elusimicrobium simillimum]|uniref:preprotein translocase subunit YajC n=1 Tax=Elusimicrobium simillimum TaxID=3143438 RepID=UPI003C6F3ED2
MENAAAGSGMNMMLMFFAIAILVFVIFSGRGEKKRAEAMKQTLDNLKKDDKVVIMGGIVGTVAGFKDDMVEIKISENNKMTVLKSGIVRVLGK